MATNLWFEKTYTSDDIVYASSKFLRNTVCYEPLLWCMMLFFRNVNQLNSRHLKYLVLRNERYIWSIFQGKVRLSVILYCTGTKQCHHTEITSKSYLFFPFFHLPSLTMQAVRNKRFLTKYTYLLYNFSISRISSCRKCFKQIYTLGHFIFR